MLKIVKLSTHKYKWRENALIHFFKVYTFSCNVCLMSENTRTLLGIFQKCRKHLTLVIQFAASTRLWKIVYSKTFTFHLENSYRFFVLLRDEVDLEFNCRCIEFSLEVKLNCVNCVKLKS